MVARHHRTRNVERARAVGYLKKADEFFDSMNHAMQAERWNAVGLNAVHCAISMADAILVKFSGTRSISNDHMVVVDLIKQNLNIKDIDNKLNALLRILAKKSLIEYDSIPFSKSDALDISKQAERFYIWSREELSK